MLGVLTLDGQAAGLTGVGVDGVGFFGVGAISTQALAGATDKMHAVKINKKIAFIIVLI